jgi:hypothetical protein
VRSLVLPDPAEAATKLETAGSEAAVWWPLARTRASSAEGVGGSGRVGWREVTYDHAPEWCFSIACVV